MHDMVWDMFSFFFAFFFRTQLSQPGWQRWMENWWFSTYFCRIMMSFILQLIANCLVVFHQSICKNDKSKWVHLPQISGWKLKKCHLSCHHPDVVFYHPIDSQPFINRWLSAAKTSRGIGHFGSDFFFCFGHVWPCFREWGGRVRLPQKKYLKNLTQGDAPSWWFFTNLSEKICASQPFPQGWTCKIFETFPRCFFWGVCPKRLSKKSSFQSERGILEVFHCILWCILRHNHADYVHGSANGLKNVLQDPG